MLQKENVKLKDENKQLLKHFGQGRAEEQIPPSSPNVCKLLAS